jgi:3-oxoacyl-(acyl-carrier-protein) synthase
VERIVITGLGVVAPNGYSVHDFEESLRQGRSGIRSQTDMRALNLRCQVAGEPELDKVRIEETFHPVTLRAVNSGMLYAGLAAVECWRDAGFAYDPNEPGAVDWATGVIVGNALWGVETVSEKLIPMIDRGMVRRMGSSLVEQFMSSAASAFVAGLLGLGGEASTISSACASGTEALVQAVRCLKAGEARRMLAGGVEGVSVHTWAAFDAMRVCASTFNEEPERASRPLSTTANGFVPAAGAGMMMLETLDSAQSRGAHIYAEILGCSALSGGQRDGGSTTASNAAGMQRCMRNALSVAQLRGGDIDYVNGHLTGTAGDLKEVENIKATLGVSGNSFPWINSTKSMVGHALGAAGAIESVATILQIARGFVHPSINTEDLHPSAESFRERIPQTCITTPISTAMKVSFGFGDANACVIFTKWDDSSSTLHKTSLAN